MKKSVSLIFLACILSSCIKTSFEKTYSVIAKKDGIWHVDKMTVTTITKSPEAVHKVDTYSDVGDFKFIGEDIDNVKLNFDGSIKLNPDYNLYYGPFEIPIDLFFDTEFETNPGGIAHSTMYRIASLSKKKMTLYVLREISDYYAGPFEFNFYFECSRK